MGPLELHLQRLRDKGIGVATQPVAGTGTIISVPQVPLHAGWNKTQTDIHFFAPEGYPFARPDCFWADEDLRLASGAMPQNANTGTPMAGLGKGALWFSWHLQTWNASRDDLNTWLAVVKQRLLQPV